MYQFLFSFIVISSSSLIISQGDSKVKCFCCLNTGFFIEQFYELSNGKYEYVMNDTRLYYRDKSRIQFILPVHMVHHYIEQTSSLFNRNNDSIIENVIKTMTTTCTC